jgi:hypothetical protein
MELVPLYTYQSSESGRLPLLQTAMRQPLSCTLVIVLAVLLGCAFLVVIFQEREVVLLILVLLVASVFGISCPDM